MSLLVDRQLRELIAPQKASVPGTFQAAPLASATSAEMGKWDSKIQPASLDLTVGRILRPIEKENDDKVLEEPSLSLEQGETVVVETKEYLTVPRTVAAIGFPPASISREGLLMTNPGHIDPGYEGRLKFTVINLGKKPIELASGKPICTLVFFSVPAPDHAYDQLDKTEKPATASDAALLRRLSKDFLNISARVKKSVKDGLRAAQINTPIISGVLALFLTLVASMVTTHFSGVNDLRVKIEGMEKTMANQQKEIEKLENKK